MEEKVTEPIALEFAGFWQRLAAFVIDTVIVIRGEQHIRAHRVTLDPRTHRPLAALEGSAPLGYIQGDVPSLLAGDGWQVAGVGGRAVGILALRGYDGTRLWTGEAGINSVYPFSVVPALTVRDVQPVHDLLCMVYSGGALENAAIQQVDITGGWQSDGSFRLTWNGKTTVVPALSSV